MFTGIIKELGSIKDIIPKEKGMRLEIYASHLLDESSIGDSIAVNGCCLTIIAKGSTWWATDILPETLELTNLGQLKVSDKVNLECAVRFGEPVGGHMVQGHIDGTGKILNKITRPDGSWQIDISAPKHLLKYMIKKGSIAVDGVSLTIVDVDDHLFSFAMIPHTGQMTTLGEKSSDSIVNLEVDCLAKYIEKLMPKACHE